MLPLNRNLVTFGWQFTQPAQAHASDVAAFAMAARKHAVRGARKGVAPLLAKDGTLRARLEVCRALPDIAGPLGNLP